MRANRGGATKDGLAPTAPSRASGRFPQLGININVLEPGETLALYHREKAQEGFLVLSGSCTLIVEGEERALRAWDYFHCPGGTAHVIVAAVDQGAVVVAVGARGRGVGGGLDIRCATRPLGTEQVSSTRRPIRARHTRRSTQVCHDRDSFPTEMGGYRTTAGDVETAARDARWSVLVGHLQDLLPRVLA